MIKIKPLLHLYYRDLAFNLFFFGLIITVWSDKNIIDEFVAHPLAISSIIVGFIVLMTIITHLYKYYFRNYRTIAVDKDYIWFGKKKYNLDFIKNIDLNSKISQGFLKKQLWEAAIITFKNGKEKYIIDDYYKDVGPIKQFLERVINKEITLPEIVPTDKPKINYDDIDKTEVRFIKGRNPLLAGGSLVMISSTVFLIYISIRIGANPFKFHDGHINPMGWLLPYFILLMLFFEFRAIKHIELSKDFIVIKHRMFFKKPTIYGLSDIKEVIIEDSHDRNTSNSLRIITKGYSSKPFTCNNYYKKHWLQLKQVLQEKGVTVVDEVYEKNEEQKE